MSIAHASCGKVGAGARPTGPPPGKRGVREVGLPGEGYVGAAALCLGVSVLFGVGCLLLPERTCVGCVACERV